MTSIQTSRSFPSYQLDLPLAKAKPISDGGIAAEITYLREGNPAGQLSLIWRGMGCERNSYVDTKCSEEGGKEARQSRDSPSASGETTG